MSTALNTTKGTSQRKRLKKKDCGCEHFLHQAEQNSAPSLQTVCIHHFWPGFFFTRRSHLERDAFVLAIFWVAPSFWWRRRAGETDLWMWMDCKKLELPFIFLSTSRAQRCSRRCLWATRRIIHNTLARRWKESFLGDKRNCFLCGFLRFQASSIFLEIEGHASVLTS